MAENKAPKAAKKALTKAAIIKEIATKTKLTNKQVNEVFDVLTTLIKQELKKKNGVFTLPGLLKLKTVRKAGTKERKGPNPFKPGEEMVFKAKPARTVVRARPLKTLNELIK